MSKEAYYFSHDSNARNDDKILELRAAYGWEGYGLYWALIETLRDSSNYCYPSDRMAGLALSLSIKKEELEKFKDLCIELGLLTEKEGFFYSESLLSRMQDFEEKKALRVARARKGAEAKHKQSTSKAQAEHKQSTSVLSKVKERKVKESKVKESKVKESKVVFPFDSENFIDAWNFWKEYKKTQHKESYKSNATEQIALKKLAELSGGNELAAIKIIEQSISNTWKGLFPLKNLNQGKNENRTPKGYDPRNIDVEALNDWINSSG